MSKRQDIITALLARFRTISVAGGYNTTPTVEEWRTFDANPGEIGDMIIVKDVSCDMDDEAAEIDDNAWDTWARRLKVQVICITEGKTSSETLRDMIEDVIEAIGTDDTLGGICRIDYEGDQTDVDRQGKTYGGTLINLGIAYRVTRWTD